MDKLEPPQAFSFVGNVSHRQFDFYLAATEKDTKVDNMYWSKKREIYETFYL